MFLYVQCLVECYPVLVKLAWSIGGFEGTLLESQNFCLTLFRGTGVESLLFGYKEMKTPR